MYLKKHSKAINFYEATEYDYIRLRNILPIVERTMREKKRIRSDELIEFLDDEYGYGYADLDIICAAWSSYWIHTKYKISSNDKSGEISQAAMEATGRYFGKRVAKKYPKLIQRAWQL